MQQYSNVAYVWQPKWLDSQGNSYVCFTPAVRNQHGVEWNYIIITNSPSYNGIWKWPAEDKNKVNIWRNGRLECYYVPQHLCEPVKKLEDITNWEVRKKIAEQQQKWFEYAKPKKVPEWFLINNDIDLQKEFPEYARLKEKK